MIITIITSLAIVVMAVAIVMLTLKTGTNEAALEKLTELTESKASAVDVQAIKNRLAEEIGETSNAEREIAEIIRRIERISADIKRLDEEIARVAKSEKEIRSYYVNFREPKNLPVYNSGVPWARDEKCLDDMTDEEKIAELGRRADSYLDAMEKGGTADMVKYTTQYNDCVMQIQKLLENKNG